MQASHMIYIACLLLVKSCKACTAVETAESLQSIAYEHVLVVSVYWLHM